MTNDEDMPDTQARKVAEQAFANLSIKETTPSVKSKTARKRIRTFIPQQVKVGGGYTCVGTKEI